METTRQRKEAGREKLQRIVASCKAAQERTLDPFLIDINQNLETLKEYFSLWDVADDLTLDSEAINCLASVIRNQGEWVRHRSTSLYTDPFLLEEKLRRLPKVEIVDAFATAWNPIVDFEQITIHSLREAMRYWNSLEPISERWKEIPPIQAEMGSTTREELLRQQILGDKAFSEVMEIFWTELKQCVHEKGVDGRMRYWDFVGAQTYEETVHRAFLTSFLVTYGYASLQLYSLEEEIFIVPRERPLTQIGKKQLVSVPIPVSVEDWENWKKGVPT